MLNILKGVKFAQDDSTGDIYAVDCYDGPKKLTGGGSGGGGGMSYDMIVTSTDGGVTLTNTSGTYADVKAKIEAHTPTHVLFLMDVVNEGATVRFQIPTLNIAIEANGEITGMIYMAGQPGPLGLFILPDGTAEIRI